LRAAVAVLGPEGVPVLGLELHEQRDRIMRGGEDQCVAGGERLERAEDRGVAHRVRDRLHVQLGDALVVLAAGAALLGRALLDRLLRGAVDLDVCHGVLLRWGRWVVGDILQCCPWKTCRAGPVPPRPAGATPPRGSSCCAPSSPSARLCRPRPWPAWPGCTRTRCAVISSSCGPTGTWPACAHAAPAAVVPPGCGARSRQGRAPRTPRSPASWPRASPAPAPSRRPMHAARAPTGAARSPPPCPPPPMPRPRAAPCSR